MRNERARPFQPPGDTVVVFARAPRLGAVKRRLAAEIGDRTALRFHTETLHRLLRMLCADRRFRTVLAVTPDRATVRLPRGVFRIGQGTGDLGQRMQRAFQRFPHRRVALIGCDIPDANAADVAAAFRSLGRADAVFGPAADGGYWLAGMGPRRPAQPFTAVRWSTQHALADTLLNFAGHEVTMLRTLRDVDTAEDWRASHAAVRPAPSMRLNDCSGTTRAVSAGAKQSSGHGVARSSSGVSRRRFKAMRDVVI